MFLSSEMFILLKFVLKIDIKLQGPFKINTKRQLISFKKHH